MDKPPLAGPPSPSVGQSSPAQSPGVSEASPAGKSIEGLRFDPRGADFTLWINNFKKQVYRNWIVPRAVLFGSSGHVDFEFVTKRDGKMSSPRMLKSSGTVALDRAARNALTGSRMMALPDDYGPSTVTMQVTFYYNQSAPTP